MPTRGKKKKKKERKKTNAEKMTGIGQTQWWSMCKDLASEMKTGKLKYKPAKMEG